MARRVLVVGWDGATWEVARPMLERGELPTLRRLVEGGASGPLRSVVHPYTAQAWTTMATGCNQGRHRIVDFWERDFSRYGFRLLNASHRAVPSLWGLLSARGRRVVVVNVPQTYPPEPVAGVLISGRDTPGLGAAYTYPPELKAELAQLAGEPYVIVPDDWLYTRRGQPDRARDELFRELRVRFRVVRELLRREAWDLAWFVVSATDGAAHFFWKYHDPSHPLYTLEDAALYGDVVREVYRRADAELGRLLEELDDEVVVLVVSDHGEGPQTPLAVHLNLWLAQEGFLAFTRGGRSGPRRTLARALRAAKHLAYDRLSFQDLTLVRRLFPDWLRGELGQETFFAGVDWSRTRAFSEEVRGNLWINLKGRDPAGIVEPGAEYEALRDELIAGLSSLRNPLTGGPLVRRVWRREDLYTGPYVERFPDLVVEADVPDVFRPRGDYQGSDAVRILSREELAALKTSGTHRMEGILVACGPGVQAGAHVRGASLQDLAPTILHLLGEPVPAHMDGRVLTELLDPSWLAASPVRREAGGPSEGGPGQEYTEEEARQVEERLAGLGYLG
ncbi:MAG: alkaline phosphatase family protein [Anaerolineae bacterium]